LAGEDVALGPGLDKTIVLHQGKLFVEFCAEAFVRFGRSVAIENFRGHGWFVGLLETVLMPRLRP